jgi:hypothetical protein
MMLLFASSGLKNKTAQRKKASAATHSFENILYSPTAKN